MAGQKDESLLHKVWGQLREYNIAEPLAALLRTFHGTPPVYLVGGFLREIVRSGFNGAPALRPKDIDLVIDTDELGAVLRAAPGYLSGTPLGGYRWKPRGSLFWLDIWQLKDTLWIKELKLPVTIESFLLGVDLNIDRIAIEIHSGEFFNGHCREALEGKTIEIDSRVHLKELMYDEYARALVASRKTGFRLSNSLRHRILSADQMQLQRRAFERLRADDYADEDIREALKLIA